MIEATELRMTSKTSGGEGSKTRVAARVRTSTGAPASHRAHGDHRANRRADDTPTAAAASFAATSDANALREALTQEPRDVLLHAGASTVADSSLFQRVTDYGALDIARLERAISEIQQSWK